ncbi:unnamed protein product [Heterobilharzia americana]|nr:unnamed protein product [Heterobilharzia americana]
METIICPYLPPVLNSSRPDAKVRHTGGLLLSPILPYLITWPLALLPPDFDANSVILPREVRILAVRKVLRLIAAIVISLPIANQSKVKSNEQGVSKYANDLLNELESNAEDAVNLTTVADAYFAQLEKLILQLHQCYDRASMCTTTSWWWVRALCEHLPRLTQIAPFSNPVNLLRHLIEEARMKFNLTTEAISSTGYQSKPPNLWKKALDYGRQEARHRLKQKKSTEVLGYRWPKVGEILRAKESIEQQYIKESKMRSKTQSEAPSPSSSDAVSSPQSEDQHRFFVASDDEDDLACTQQEEIVDSSDEENCNANQFHKLQRLQSLFYITLKAEPIETPPALKDVAELVERVLLHCQPVAVSTIRQILSDSDSVFTPSLEKSMSNLMKSTEMR